MADIGQWVKDYLEDFEGVTDLVSDRIRPVLKQGETMPAITYEVISSVPQDDLRYQVNEKQSRLYLRCYAASQTGAVEVADAVKATNIRGFRGSNNGKFINEAAIVEEFDGREPPVDGQDAWRFPRVIELMITHN